MRAVCIFAVAAATNIALGEGSLCITHEEGQTPNVVLRTCDGSDNQEWTLSNDNIQSMSTPPVCLQVAGKDDPSAHSTVDASGCSNAVAQSWAQTDQGGLSTRLDESLCLDVQDLKEVSGSALGLRACDKDPDPAQVGPSAALLEKYERTYRQEDIEAIQALSSEMSTLKGRLLSQLTNAYGEWKLKFDTMANKVQSSAKKVKSQHRNNHQNFHAILPQVEQMLKEATPLIESAAGKQTVQNDVNPAEFIRGKMDFMKFVSKLEGEYVKKMTDLMKKYMTMANKFAKADNKAWTKRDKVAQKWSRNVWKVFQRLEKRADKAQSKMSTVVQNALEDLMDHVGHVEEQSSDLEEMQEEQEGTMEYLLEDGNPENPALEQVEEGVDEMKEGYMEDTEDMLSHQEEAWTNDLQKMMQVLKREETRYQYSQMRQIETPTKALAHFALKVQKALALVATRVTKNGAKSALKNKNQLAKAKYYEDALERLATVVENTKENNYVTKLEQFRASLERGLYNVVAWAEKRLPTDHTALESYVTKSHQLLTANTDKEFSKVEQAGMGQLMDLWIRFLGQQLAIHTSMDKSQKGLLDLRAPIEKDRQKLGDALGVAERITDMFDSMLQLPATVSKGGTDVKRLANDMSVKQTQGFQALVSQIVHKLNLMGSQKKTDMTRVLEEGGKEIVNQASAVMHQIDMSSRDTIDTTKQLKYEMAETDKKLVDFEMKLKHQNGELSRNVPQKLKGFGDFFKQQMATNSYELDDMLTILTAYAKEAFQTGNQNITEIIGEAKKSISDYIVTQQQQLEGEEKKVEEELATTGVVVNAGIADLDTSRKELTRDALAPVSSAMEIGPKMDQGMMRFAANLGKAIDVIDRLRQQLADTRNSVSTKAKEDTTEIQSWYNDQVSDVIRKLGIKISESIRNVNLALEKVEMNTNERLKQNTKLVDEHQTKLEKLVSGLPELIDAVLKPWKAGGHNQAVLAWSEDLRKMEGALDHASNAPRLIAKMAQDTILGYQEQAAVEEDQFRFDNQQVGKKVRKSVGGLQERLKNQKRKIESRMEQVEQDSALRIQAMGTRMADTQAETTLAKRRMAGGASAIMRAFSSYAEGAKKSIHEMVSNQEDTNMRLRMVDQNNAEQIRSAVLRIERGTSGAERSATKMENNLGYAMDTLDMTQRKRDIESKVAFLSNMEAGRSKESGVEADDAITAVNAITMQALDRVEKTMKAFAAQNNELGAVATERQRKFGTVRDDVSADDEKVRDILSNFHEVTNDLTTNIQEQQDRVEAKHKKNEDNLAMMTGLTSYNDADALMRVVRAVRSQSEMDDEVQTDVDGRILPQMAYWRDGVTKIFEKLGMDLDLDAVHEKAKRMLAEELMQREQLNSAGNELQAYLHAEALMARLGQRAVDKHMRGTIDDIMARTDITIAEKLRMIQEARDTYNRKHMTVNQKIAQVMAQQSDAQIEMSAMTGQIEAMVKRAREVARPPWKLINMFALSKKKDATKVVADKIKQDLLREIQKTAEARLANKQATGLTLMQMQPGSLLEEAGGAASALDRLQTTEQRLRAAAEKREEVDAAWENQLDGLEIDDVNLRRGEAPA